MKVSQKIQQAHADDPNMPTISFEYFVPKTPQGVQNLYDRIDRMFKLNPLFIDVTWNAGGVGSNMTAEIVNTTQSTLGVETVMHLTCMGMPVSEVDQALEDAKAAGCQNILALRGDPPRTLPGEKKPRSEFRYAKDLIRHIREKYGDYFDIGVAGYPEGHPEESDSDLLITYLKEKVDAGATFVVTQMVYDVDYFIDWVQRCRDAGINVPIIPGIMPISGWASFLRRAKWCQVKVPQKFLDELEPYSNDDAAIREQGSQLVADMCVKMIAAGIKHLHFYTMNLEKATLMVLEKMNVLNVLEERQHSPLPWRQSLGYGREKEGVRPIFWRNRKHSYITRTATWDEFPNGRWGDATSPAFGELERYGVLLRQSPEKANELWGQPSSVEDLATLIIKYVYGRIPALPWSDDPLAAEINVIQDHIVALNQKGWLTINSQPAVNGLPSTHPLHGWGPAGGYVYQKAYLELLIPKQEFEKLRPRLESDPQVTYYAVCGHCAKLFTNNDKSEANAVTWGVFPGSEIKQPTIVEKLSFLAWKDEAFRLNLEWASCYPEDSPARNFLTEVASSFYLVNIVHNDFQDPEAVFRLFD